MPDDPSSEINHLLEKFKFEFTAGSKPEISDYVLQVAESQREELARKLISADVILRVATGEQNLSADDYHSLGDFAVEHAANEIEKQVTDELDLKTIAPVGSAPSPQPADKRQIGPYKLLKQIGEGGMGTVWMADQEKPVRRRVALKLIKGAIADKQIIARFEAERQALAMMDHQNIAKVLDAGTTESGNPYFVMELVQGIPINEYCDRNKLTPNDRLKLFVSVCKAVQHAHQKGIIHRDLKPSNVLVAIQDGKPVAKVIDFGLAKALQHQTRLTDKTMFTEFGQVVGTLQYMSPEQAMMDALNVDTRSDIYSLGVMLYELLAGSTPIEQETLKNNALLQILDVIREKEPPKPSHRLSSSGEKAQSISDYRQIQPSKLQQILRGELDWIVMKAIEKDPTRRYETANNFAEDIARYLGGDVVEARPPSTGYRLQKFVQKNRGLVATLATIAALLITAVGVSSWFAVEANRATGIANTERGKADSESKRARDSENAARYQLANARFANHRIAEANLLLDQIPEEYRKFEWYYSRRHFQGSDVTLFGHDYRTSVAFSSDGQLIASGSTDGTIKFWHARTGAELFTLEHHFHLNVSSIAFSPDSQRIASGGQDKTIKLWDTTTGAELLTLRGHTNGVNHVAFSPDGKLIASGAGPSDSTIKLWDAQNGTELLTFSGHDGGVDSVVFSPDGKQIASAGGGYDGLTKLWDIVTGAELKTFSEHNGGANCLAFSPDGKLIACGVAYDTDFEFNLLDAQTGDLLKTFSGHTDRVTSLEFSPDGAVIASGSGDNTVKLWGVKSGDEIKTYYGHLRWVESVAFSPDGQRIVSCSQDRTIKIWDAVTREQQQIIHGHSGSIRHLTFSSDGKRIASASGHGENAIKLWDANSGAGLLTLDGFDDDPFKAIRGVAFSPDGRRIASAVRGESKVKVWDAITGDELLTLNGQYHYLSVVFSPDGKRIACSGPENIKIWDSKTGEEVLTLTPSCNSHWGFGDSIAFSPDGQYIAGQAVEGTVNLWDAKTGAVLNTLVGENIGEANCVDFNAEGKLVATGHTSGIIRLWNVKTGSELLTLSGHTGMIHSVSFSPDNLRIASGSDDGTVKIWDAKTGDELLTFGVGGEIISVAFSPDGRRIAIGRGGRIEFRDARNLAEGATIMPDEEAYREAKSRISPFWHKIYAEGAEKKMNWYAETFHRAWLMKSDPDEAENYDLLHAAHKKLASEYAQQERDLTPLLQPIVREMLKLPRPVSGDEAQ